MTEKGHQSHYKPHRFAESVFFLCQLAVILLFAFCTKFDDGIAPTTDASLADSVQETLQSKYSMWQDVHVMVYIGFGFLMVFLKTHSWTSVCFNFLIAAWAFEWAILNLGFWEQVFEGPGHHWHKIKLNTRFLVDGDFAAASGLIAMGAVLGKTNIFQLWFLITFQMVFYSINFCIVYILFKCADIGGSMVIHTFGAYFGLAASFFFYSKKAIKDEKGRAVGAYNSQLIAMIGTVFLYLFWPSFNAALGNNTSQTRTIIITALAIASSCITACACARLVKGGLDMEVVLNATLAGGVAIGASADLIAQPGTALAIGASVGIISAFGFMHLSPYLKEKIGLHDTCGVHNLHGMPGIFGGIMGSLTASQTIKTFQNANAATALFPAMDKNMKEPNIYHNNLPLTFHEQAGMQLAGLAVTIGIAIVTGALSGFICSKFGDVEELFDDKEHFHGCEYDIDPDHKEEPKKDLKEERLSLTVTKNKEENRQQPSETPIQTHRDQEHLQNQD